MTTPDALDQGIELQGRMFFPSKDTTFEQDIYVMSVMQDAGLQEMAAKFDVDKLDRLDETAEGIIIHAFNKGKLFEMLGAVLEEENVEWSIEDAKDNAAFFSKLRNPEDKKQLRGAIVSVILGFFVSGLLSYKTSQTSLSGSSPSNLDVSLSPSKTLLPEDSISSERGAESSENSPDGESMNMPSS